MAEVETVPLLEILVAVANESTNEIYRKGQHQMSKVIKHVKARGMGHIELAFEDGTQEVVTRGNHEQHALKAGDVWPKSSAADLDAVAAENEAK